ncbi:MAG: hypothetical protein K2M56_02910 [Muribaculaceae bacterium]|nr:hypothetical protein [Muribaculaceae bacterium]
MDTMALVVVRMGGERRFASLLRICDPMGDVDCWEEYSPQSYNDIDRMINRIKEIWIR